jgi:hypothetical protein
MNWSGIIKDFFKFLREQKRWWLTPILIFLGLLVLLLALTKGSSLAPFIYNLF